MPVEQSSQVRSDLVRKVWVENIMTEPYAESYKGDIIEIPGAGKIAMPVMDANKFVGQFKRPLKKVNGQWVGVDGPKPLRVVEMSEEDRKKIEGVTPEQQVQAEKAADMKAKCTCQKCGFEAASEKGLKIHSSSIHPETAENE